MVNVTIKCMLKKHRIWTFKLWPGAITVWTKKLSETFSSLAVLCTVTPWCCLASTMDGTPTAKYGADGDGWEDESYFIEGPSSSDDELEFDIWEQKHHSISCKQTAALSGESCPLLLAFSITSGRKLRDDSSSTASSLDAQAEEEAFEEWMILERGEQSGDSSIQLNLSYSNSSEDDSPDEGETILNVVLGIT